MGKILRKCPVCGKLLTESEFDKALGKVGQFKEHIKHLKAEREKLKKQQKLNNKRLEEEKKNSRGQRQQQAKDFKRMLTESTKKANQKLKDQGQKMDAIVKRGIQKGVKEEKKLFKKQVSEFKKTRNKMNQLENSLKISVNKSAQANEEIKKLKEQIAKGITPQIEGLLEEDKLLAKLKNLFPQDKFEHPKNYGDIIQIVIEQRKEIGKIMYECKKRKSFDKKWIEKAKEDRDTHHAEFAILVTNVFPSKKQYYFVEKNVFVISPVSLEPITYTLRESLVKMALLKMSNEAKQKAVQKVYDYLSSNEYNNKMNDIACQLMELGKDLESEVDLHKKRWRKRYHIYRGLFNDIGMIDSNLKSLVHNKLEYRQKLLPPPKRPFVVIEELSK